MFYKTDSNALPVLQNLLYINDCSTMSNGILPPAQTAMGTFVVTLDYCVQERHVSADVSRLIH